MDRISSLPDEILEHILSFLPTKEAASTSLLSKRWRYVFVLVPNLNLVYNDGISFAVSSAHYLYNKRRNFIDFVENLLHRQGKFPIKKLTLKIHHFGVDLNRIQNWIFNLLERGVVDLNLFIYYRGNFSPLLILKNNSLVKLRLGRGFRIDLSQDVYLPKLKTLCLDSIDFDGVVVDKVFTNLLPRCPVLEELVIEDLKWYKWCDPVSSPSLKKLCIRFFNLPVIHLDLPNLVYLELSCIFGSKYAYVKLDSLFEARLNLWVEPERLPELRRGSSHLISSDGLDLMNLIIGIENVRVLHLTSDALELCYFYCQELPMFHNLVRLSISSDKKHGWQSLPLLINNSPSLETLIFKGLQHYKTINCGDVCVCYGEKSLSCLSSCHLKVLEIWGYKGSSREVKQMKHFLKKLPCLEMVKIQAVNNLRVPIYIQQLLEFPIASLNCKIQAMF